MSMYNEIKRKIDEEFGVEIPVKKEKLYTAYANLDAVRRNEPLEQSNNKFKLTSKYPKALIDEVFVNEAEFKEYKSRLADANKKAYNVWIHLLKKQNSHINDKVFNVCLSMALSNHITFSEAEEKLEDYIEFALDIIKINGETNNE